MVSAQNTVFLGSNLFNSRLNVNFLIQTNRTRVSIEQVSFSAHQCQKTTLNPHLFIVVKALYDMQISIFTGRVKRQINGISNTKKSPKHF